MNNKSQILTVILVLLVVVSIIATYYRVFVRHDYQILMEVSCDPAVESCFVYQCDPEIEECTGDPEEDTWYYKLLEKNASMMPVCDTEAEECPEPACAEGEMNCSITHCDLEAGEECSSPEDFIEEPELESVDEADVVEDGLNEGEVE